ncbi:MAG: hypothetical protein DHS20C18_07880 [Saprospiraceae bacterium]|nr:MAG: hypothetical protein DHS20C18_07880 [Saprospiraceae bacterium]
MAYTQRPTIEDFTMSGDTYEIEDYCFRLTDEKDYASGSIWYRKPISLSVPFSIELSIMLGCQDETGADGMVFMFAAQPNRTGYRGEGIGFAGLSPSLGIEIDTWRNYHLNDPAEDHLAFLINGQVGHFSEMSAPTPIPNLEDCRRHKLTVRWKPDQQRLSVEIDGKEIVATNYDLLNRIFQGNEIVYWGVSAATGRYNNFHEVCFDRLSYRTPRHLPSLRMKDVRKLWAMNNER